MDPQECRELPRTRRRCGKRVGGRAHGPRPAAERGQQADERASPARGRGTSARWPTGSSVKRRAASATLGWRRPGRRPSAARAQGAQGLGTRGARPRSAGGLHSADREAPRTANPRLRCAAQSGRAAPGAEGLTPPRAPPPPPRMSRRLRPRSGGEQSAGARRPPAPGHRDSAGDGSGGWGRCLHNAPPSLPTVAGR